MRRFPPLLALILLPSLLRGAVPAAAPLTEQVRRAREAGRPLAAMRAGHALQERLKDELLTRLTAEVFPGELKGWESEVRWVEPPERGGGSMFYKAYSRGSHELRVTVWVDSPLAEIIEKSRAVPGALVSRRVAGRTAFVRRRPDGELLAFPVGKGMVVLVQGGTPKVRDTLAAGVRFRALEALQ